MVGHLTAEYKPRRGTAIERTDDRYPGLDGLRGLAILGVMLFHMTRLGPGHGLFNDIVVACARMGWAGVDLFFVLSGFLITGILIRTKGAPSYFKSFYARRILRILPLYVMTCVLLLHVVRLVPAFADDNWFWVHDREISPAWYWLFLSNWKVAIDGQFHHNLMAVSWSLAIEEQFYLLWPAIVLAASANTLRRICIGVIAGALVLRIALVVGAFPVKGVYVLTPCRFDGLAVGGWLALAWADPARRARCAGSAAKVAGVSALALVGLVVGITAGGQTDRPFQLVYHPVMQTAGYSALAVLFGACLVLSLDSGSRFTRALSRAPLVLLGRYSYFMYLAHVPVAWAVRDHVFQGRIDPSASLPGQILYWLAGIGVCVVLGALSWRFFESPILSMKARFRYERRTMRA